MVGGICLDEVRWDLSRRSTMGSVAFPFDGFWPSVISDALDFQAQTRQLVDLWIDILHLDEEVGDLLVFYLLSSTNRRFFGLEKLSLYHYRAADIASWWRADNGYDRETPVSCPLVCFSSFPSWSHLRWPA